MFGNCQQQTERLHLIIYRGPTNVSVLFFMGQRSKYQIDTKIWYSLYQSLVLLVPRLGTAGTNIRYQRYHNLVDF